jgi:hypothetical protein
VPESLAPETTKNSDHWKGLVNKKIRTTEVRQGETPHIVRYMLAISLAAAVIALAIVAVVLIR